MSNIRTYIFIFKNNSVYTSIQCICTYLPTCIHTFIPTYLPTYLPKYIHTLHYITLHYIKLHYIILHYITLHYITYMHTYIHTYRRLSVYRISFFFGYTWFSTYYCPCFWLYVGCLVKDSTAEKFSLRRLLNLE